MADFIFELAAFECRDLGKAGAGTHTGTVELPRFDGHFC
jgi:hypothetical protein